MTLWEIPDFLFLQLLSTQLSFIYVVYHPITYIQWKFIWAFIQIGKIMKSKNPFFVLSSGCVQTCDIYIMGSATYKNLGGGHKWQLINIQYIPVLYTGAAPEFWFEEETSKIILYINFSQVLYCNGVSKTSVEGDIQHKCTHQRLL